MARIAVFLMAAPCTVFVLRTNSVLYAISETDPAQDLFALTVPHTP